VLFDKIFLPVEHIAFCLSFGGFSVSSAAGGEVCPLDDGLGREENEMEKSSFSLSLIVSPRNQSVVHHVHDGQAPTLARRLHLELAERAWRIGYQYERRQPESQEFRLERLRLLALAPARSGLPGLSMGGRVEFELALRSMS
jgi:hypothetical protein